MKAPKKVPSRTRSHQERLSPYDALWLLVPGKTLHLGKDAMVRTEDSTAGELQLEKSYIS